MTNKTQTKSRKIAVLAFTLVFIADTSLVLASEITTGKMIELTNGSRRDAGLETLAVNDRLESAAKAKADDMLINQYFEHTSPQGITPWHWFEQAGYEYVYAAENLAIDFVTSEGAHKALMESPTHRENILGKNYKEIGIAVVSGEFEGKDTILIVEEFGSQREHKITVNNAAFFEPMVAVNEEPAQEVPASEMKPRQQPVIVINRAAGKDVPLIAEENGAEMDAVPEVETEQEAEGLAELVPSSQPESVSHPEVKSLPKAYTVRSIPSIKKAYVQDIYWEAADREGSFSSLGSATSAIKLLLRDFTAAMHRALP